MKSFIIFIGMSLFTGLSLLKAQYSYGTTGLLNMPTADMQRDKTLLIGGSFIDNHTSVARWYYDTYNYYVNITMFPWLEIGYNMILHKSVQYDPALGNDYWVPYTYGKFTNQDRSFHVRLRVWKEGWWKSWTPQIVFGGNDCIGSIGGVNQNEYESQVNGFTNRWYIAVTKHGMIKSLGTYGAHISYIWNKRNEYPLNGVSVGMDFRFQLTNTPNTFKKVLNGLTLMVEAYPADGRGTWFLESKDGTKHLDRGVAVGKYDINVGASYSIWKDYINLIGELYGCKDFSGGVQFKVHPK